MLFLPYDHFTIQTGAPPQEARDRLAPLVRKPTWSALFQRKDGPPYEGTVAETTFKIQRVIRYRNSFLPVVVGAIRPSPLGTEIEITMRMQAPVIGFMVVWFGLLAAILSAGAFGGSSESAGSGTGCAVGLFMFAAAYGMMTIGFHYEAAKARTFLEEVFSGLSPAPPPSVAEPVSPAPAPRARSARPWVGGASEALRYGRSPSEDEDSPTSQR